MKWLKTSCMEKEKGENRRETKTGYVTSWNGLKHQLKIE